MYILFKIIYIYVDILYTFAHRYTQLMTNIVNKMPEKKMQTHIQKAYSFLDDHLPYEYTNEVIATFKKQNIEASSSVIRNVRNGITTTRSDVLNALLLVAKKHKKLKEKIESNLNDN